MPETYIEWRIIPQYSRYEASNTGLVRSRLPCDRHAGNFILKPRNKTRHIYPMYRVIGDDGKRRCVYLHHLVIRAFHGPKPYHNAVCRHLDGNAANNAPGNLIWGTAKENVEDAIRHGTFRPFGVRRLDCDPFELQGYWRALRKIGWSNTQVALMYKCHPSLIGKWAFGPYSSFSAE